MKIIMIDALVGNNYTVWLCRGLAQAGHEVTLITTEDYHNATEPTFTICPAAPAKVLKQNKMKKSFKYIYYLLWLFVYLYRSDADIVHFQFFRRTRIECVYFAFLRLVTPNLVYTAHNILPHEHTQIDYYLFKIVYRSATKIIVHTAALKQKLLNTYTLNENKIFVVPAVRPISGKNDQAITPALARAYFGLLPDEKVLLFFGRIREYKGVDLLLEAFDLARQNVDRLTLIIGGEPYPPQLLEQYQCQIDRMAHSEHVIYHPKFIPTEEVDYYFQASDALAMPYKHIDFSGLMQAAFAYQRPVLATNVGNFAEMIINEENGCISEENTPEAFAHMIVHAFGDMDRLAQMGQAAYEIDQAHPNEATIGTMTATVYAA